MVKLASKSVLDEECIVCHCWMVRS